MISRSSGAAAVGVRGQPAGEPAGGVSHARLVRTGGGAAVRVAVGRGDGGRVAGGGEVGGRVAGGGAVVTSGDGDSLVGSAVTDGAAAREGGSAAQPASSAQAAATAIQERTRRR